MIVTDRFAFVHLHKAGGTFVNEFLLRFFPDARELGYHLPLRLLPASHRDRPVFGFVRNPYAYYLSWYSFQRDKPRANALFQALSDDGRLGLGATIANLLRLSSDDALLDRVLPLMPEAYGGRGINLPRAELARIRGTGAGFYSFLYDHLFRGEPRAQVARADRLRPALEGFLASLGIALTPAMLDALRQGAPRNTSAHGKVAEAYDAGLAQLVAERDAPLIETFGFSLDDA
jgi:hypothetical protein